MTSVAVVAHRRKQLGGGLGELRDVLARAGVVDPLWYEVAKSRKAAKAAKRAAEAGADLVFVWGGDGTVQRCIDALAGRQVAIAVLPAGTANLLATNLGIPVDLRAAVEIGLGGRRRALDVGVVNGERFGVMAGVGFDARMIRDADHGLKDRFGRLAYVWTGARNLRAAAVPMRVKTDGDTWFRGPVGCVLVANVSRISGGVKAFPDARPDDGLLDVGVVTAQGVGQWLRTLVRTALGRPERSPFVHTTRATQVDVRLDEPLAYELDGGDREPTDRLRFAVEPAAVTVCVPDKEDER